MTIVRNGYLQILLLLTFLYLGTACLGSETSLPLQKDELFVVTALPPSEMTNAIYIPTSIPTAIPTPKPTPTPIPTPAPTSTPILTPSPTLITEIIKQKKKIDPKEL